MEKVLEIISQIKQQHLTDRQLGLLDLLEEAMKPKTCDDCEDEMLDAECFPCSYCTRCYQDRYKLKEKL